MKLFLNSINYHNCPVEQREIVSLGQQNRSVCYKKMHIEDAVSEAVILQTCNRTEFYLYARNKEVIAYVFITCFALSLFVICWLRRKKLKSFLKESRMLFVQSGIKMSLFGLGIGAVVLCFHWGKSVLRKNVSMNVFIIVLAVFSVLAVSASFLKMKKKE